MRRIVLIKLCFVIEPKSTYLQNHAFDECVYARREYLRSALEAPEDDSALAEDREQVEHLVATLIITNNKNNSSNCRPNLRERPARTHALRHLC